MGGLGVATIKSSQDGRFIAGVADNAHLIAVLKIGRTDDLGLANEARFLTLLERTGLVPELVAAGEHHGRFFIATRAVPRIARSSAVSVEQAADLATALQASNAFEPIVHGDLTPWNVVPTRDCLVLVDWEHAAVGVQPMYDLTHFVVQCGALLGRWSAGEASALLTEPGSPGVKHLAALGIDEKRAPMFVRAYLSSARPSADIRVDRFREVLERVLE
jgi:hypothetical protein